MSVEGLRETMSRKLSDGCKLEADRAEHQSRQTQPGSHMIKWPRLRLAQRAHRKDEQLASLSVCEVSIRAMTDTVVTHPATLKQCVDQVIYIEDYYVFTAEKRPKLVGNNVIKAQEAMDESTALLVHVFSSLPELLDPH